MATSYDPQTWSSGQRPKRPLSIMEKDLAQLYKERPKNIFVVKDRADQYLAHALIIGPENTPYHNGFFYFTLMFPSDYPFSLPRVKLMTTHAGSVRFLPNIHVNLYGSYDSLLLDIMNCPPVKWWYADWTPAHTVLSILCSIQGLMSPQPYFNEPTNQRKDKRSAIKASDDYNDYLIYETMRVAVIWMLETGAQELEMPDELKSVMLVHFIKNYSFYEELMCSHLFLDEKLLINPLKPWDNTRTFRYNHLMVRLHQLKSAHDITEMASRSFIEFAQTFTYPHFLLPKTPTTTPLSLSVSARMDSLDIGEDQNGNYYRYYKDLPKMLILKLRIFFDSFIHSSPEIPYTTVSSEKTEDSVSEDESYCYDIESDDDSEDSVRTEGKELWCEPSEEDLMSSRVGSSESETTMGSTERMSDLDDI